MVLESKDLQKKPNDTLEEIEQMLKMSVFQENILTQDAKEYPSSM